VDQEIDLTEEEINLEGMGEALTKSFQHSQATSSRTDHSEAVTGLFRSNENAVELAIDHLALVLREASRDQR